MNALIFVHKLWVDYEPLLREDRTRHKDASIRFNAPKKVVGKSDGAFERETPVPPSATVAVRHKKAERG